jgi:osmotically-inducible protein OsmY
MTIGCKQTAIQPVEDRELATRVVTQAQSRLADSSHFRGHQHAVRVEYEDGVLLVRGCVPSFYLKQVLQTLLVNVEGVETIDNQVDVSCPSGLSSVRPR